MFSKKKILILPTVLAIPSNFELIALKNFLLPALQTQKKSTYSIRYLNDLLTIEIDIVEKKGIFNSNVIQLEHQNQNLIIKINNKIYDSNQEDVQEDAIALKSYKNSIKKNIYSYVNSSFNEGFYITDSTIQNPYICKLSLLQKNSILKYLQHKESVLACLEIQNCKGGFDLPKKSETYLLVTSQRTCIFSYGDTDAIINISDQMLTHIAKLGKDTILGESFECQTELFNDTLFEDLKEIIKQVENNRVEKFNDILFLKSPKKSKAISLIKKGYLKAATKTGLLPSKLKQTLVSSFLPKEKKHNFDIVNLKAFLECIEGESTSGLLLIQVFKDWKISTEKQYSFLEFLLTLHIKNSIHMTLWVEYVFALICQEEKKINKTINSRKQHIDFLISTKQYQRTIPFYEYIIDHSPNSDILSLLSDNTIAIVHGEDVDPNYVLFIEGLIKAKNESGFSSFQEKLMLLKLQPFLAKRRDEISKNEGFSHTVNQVIRLFSKSLFDKNKLEHLLNHDIPESTALYNLVVPPSFGKASDFTSYMSGMIASVDLPDYNKVIEFSELLNAQNYPQVTQIIITLSEQLSLPIPVCYLGRGSYSGSIIGIEGTPNYMIIGVDRLSESSPQYLDENELRFMIATELAHMLFKHTRITAQDVWVGAREKGTNLAEIALIALPIVGTIGGLAGKFTDISRFTKLFKGVEQVNNVIDKGQSTLSYGEKIIEKIPNKESEKERTLLASSRLMEISADRVGLLTTKNIKTAICAILKSRKHFQETKKIIEREGLIAYLSKKDSEGSFTNQELTIRIKTLISFYLNHEHYFKQK